MLRKKGQVLILVSHFYLCWDFCGICPIDTWARMRVRVSPRRLFGSLRGCFQYSPGGKRLVWLSTTLMQKSVVGVRGRQMPPGLTLVHNKCKVKTTLFSPSLPPSLLPSFSFSIFPSFPLSLPLFFCHFLPFPFLYMPLQCREWMLVKHS